MASPLATYEYNSKLNGPKKEKKKEAYYSLEMDDLELNSRDATVVI